MSIQRKSYIAKTFLRQVLNLIEHTNSQMTKTEKVTPSMRSRGVHLQNKSYIRSIEIEYDVHGDLTVSASVDTYVHGEKNNSVFNFNVSLDSLGQKGQKYK